MTDVSAASDLSQLCDTKLPLKLFSTDIEFLFNNQLDARFEITRASGNTRFTIEIKSSDNNNDLTLAMIENGLINENITFTAINNNHVPLKKSN